MIYKIRKKMEIAGAHSLSLPYESKCNNLHGHNWIIEVEIVGTELNKENMLIDFTQISTIINKLDHQNLNEILPLLNPTAENIAKWIATVLNKKLLSKWHSENINGNNADCCPVGFPVSWLKKVREIQHGI